jgi:hypothetical protein
MIATLVCVAACGSPTTTPSSQSSGTGTSSEVTPAATVTVSPAQTVTPAGSRTPTPTPTVTGARTLTEADAGTTIVLKVGESVEVSLGAEYTPPSSDGPAVMRTSTSGGYPTGRPVRATFRAVQRGNADISSSTDYACLHVTPSCALPQQLWSVHVTVA